MSEAMPQPVVDGIEIVTNASRNAPVADPGSPDGAVAEVPSDRDALAELGGRIAGDLRRQETGVSGEDLDHVGSSLLDDPNPGVQRIRTAALHGETVMDARAAIGSIPAELERLRADQRASVAKIKADRDLSQTGKQSRRQDLHKEHERTAQAVMDTAFREATVEVLSLAIGEQSGTVRVVEQAATPLDRGMARAQATDRLRLVLAIHGVDALPGYVERVGRRADPVLPDLVEVASEVGVPDALALEFGAALRSIDRSRSKRVREAVLIGPPELLEAVVKRATLRSVRARFDQAHSQMSELPLDPGLPTMVLRQLDESLGLS